MPKPITTFYKTLIEKRCQTLNREIPRKYKNQLNGKTAQENYAEYKREQQKEFVFDRHTIADLENLVEKSLSDILATLKFAL